MAGGKPTAEWSAADELMHRSASSLSDVRHGAGAVWLARGVAVNKSGHEGALRLGEELSPTDRMKTKAARALMLASAEMVDNEIVRMRGEGKAAHSAATLNEMHRFTYRAAIAAANMTRKLDASSAQVEYQEVLSRIRAHGLLGDRSFDGLLKKTEEMMQAAEIEGRCRGDVGEM